MSKTKAINEDNFKILFSLSISSSPATEKNIEKDKVYEDDYLTNLNYLICLKQLIDQIKIQNKDNDYLMIIISDHGK